MSLWGGDAVFSNLDLRLDVLERELGLPFSVVSGHIHELQIHVPWTRLNTEPIVITINTIGKVVILRLISKLLLLVLRSTEKNRQFFLNQFFTAKRNQIQI